jgi:RND family efflux transporter MFP subunit
MHHSTSTDYPMKSILNSLSGFAIVAAMLAGCNSAPKPEQSSSNSEAIAVKTLALKKQIRERSFSGTGLLSTGDEALYSFKIGGVIDKINVMEGQFFNKGQVLATLKLTEIEAGVAQAKLGLEKAKRDHERVLRLYADSVTTLEQVQNSETALKVSERQLEALNFNKTHAVILAAEAGFVKRKLANEGEVVATGSPILAISESSAKGWVLKVGLSDADWALIKEADEAEVQFDAFPNQLFIGKVLRKAMAADQGSGSFTIEVEVNLKGIKPAVGMFGKAIIKSGKPVEMISIPYEALIEADGMKAFVYIPLQTDQVKKQAIEIESFDNKEVWVKSGLENIERIVISNSAFLNENARILIVND